MPQQEQQRLEEDVFPTIDPQLMRLPDLKKKANVPTLQEFFTTHYNAAAKVDADQE